MDRHGSWIPGRRARASRRNSRHRIPHPPFFSSNVVSTPALVDREKAASPGPGVRAGCRRLGKKETRRQRPGIAGAPLLADVARSGDFDLEHFPSSSSARRTTKKNQFCYPHPRTCAPPPFSAWDVLPKISSPSKRIRPSNGNWACLLPQITPTPSSCSAATELFTAISHRWSDLAFLCSLSPPAAATTSLARSDCTVFAIPSPHGKDSAPAPPTFAPSTLA